MKTLKTLKTKKLAFLAQIKGQRSKLLICLFLITACSNHAMAQEEEEYEYNRGFFNSLTIGASASTAGIGIDLATPIGNYFALRAGITIMPDFKYSDDVNIDIPYQDRDYPSYMNVEGTLKRTSGEVLLNFYPSPKGKFFICGGFVFGGDRLLQIKAHTDNSELLNLIREGEKVGIEIGDYNIPINENGDISGGFKVASFRPYIGFGTGRVTPKKRLGLTFEAGVQFHKSPKIYTDYGSLGELKEEADNGFSDIMDALSVYPVVKIRLCGRIF